MGLGNTLLRMYELGLFGESPQEKFIKSRNAADIERERIRNEGELKQLQERYRLENEYKAQQEALQRQRQEQGLADLAGSYDIFTQSPNLVDPLGLGADTAIKPLNFSAIPAPFNNQMFDVKRGRAIADIYGNRPLADIPGVEAEGAKSAASKQSSIRGETLARDLFPQTSNITRNKANIESELSGTPAYKDALESSILGLLLKDSLISTLPPGSTAFGAKGDRLTGAMPTEEITMRGGVVDPNSGQLIGGEPVVTRGYAPAYKTPALKMSPEDASRLPVAPPTTDVPPAASPLSGAVAQPPLAISDITTPAVRGPVNNIDPTGISSNFSDTGSFGNLSDLISGSKSNRYDVIPKQQLQLQSPGSNIEIQLLKQRLNTLLHPSERKALEERIKLLELMSQPVPR